MIQGLAARKTKMSVDVKEDSLTSSVFGTILLLPSELIWNIILNSCFDKSLPVSGGEIQEFDFWPRWQAQNTTNSNFVEPDLFIRFENFDIIIEAKRWEKNQQYKDQWINQYEGYKNEYINDSDGFQPKKDLIYFAVGGIRNKETEIIKNELNIYKIQWGNILSEMSTLKEKFENFEYQISQNSANLRIIETVIKSFELHGYFTGKWLESIPKIKFKSDKPFETILNWRPNE